MFQGFVSAIRTLTVLPVPGEEANHMSDSLPWFPLVGCLLGLILLCLAQIGRLFLESWAEGVAVVILVGSVFLTRGFHLDGLADFADGFAGGRDRLRTLVIMKDSDVGAFGAMLLVLVLLVKWVTLTLLVKNKDLYWIVDAYIISRATMVELATCLPYAREEGGTAGPFVDGAQPRHRLYTWLLSLSLLLIINGLAGVTLLMGGWIGCRLLGFWFDRRVGGVTGDLLGACSEIIETGVLFFCAAASHWLVGFTTWGILS